MARRLRTRFWFDLVLAIVSTLLFALTAIRPDWIELLTGLEPDEGSGSLEWLIVGVIAVIAVVSWLAARFEWRRAAAGAG